MLPDVGLGEIIVIAVVALIVVKPEDVPELMRKAGVLTATAQSWLRGMWLGMQEPAKPRKPVSRNKTDTE